MCPADVVDLMARRPPVCYSIHVSQSWDGTITFTVEGVSDDDRSRQSVATAMRAMASLLDPNSGVPVTRTRQ